MNVTIPITILKGNPDVNPVSLEVEGYLLLGYASDGSNAIYYEGTGDNKKYFDPDEGNIGFVITEEETDVYSAAISDSYEVDASEISVIPYTEDGLTVSCDVTGTDPNTGQLIVDIYLNSGSGEGDFVARNCHVTTGELATIPLSSFVGI